MAFFTESENVIEMGATYLKIDAFVLYAYVILFVHVAALQGIKRPVLGVWIGLFRQLLAPTIVFYLLTQVLHVGLIGIWWGIFSVTWFAAVITIFYGRRILNKEMNVSQRGN